MFERDEHHHSRAQWRTEQTKLGVVQVARKTLATFDQAARKSLIFLIQLYRWTLSPWVGGHCRFHPTCSDYAQQVIHSHGIFAGSWLTLKRLGRCHPWHPGGFDPPPNTNNAVDR